MSLVTSVEQKPGFDDAGTWGRIELRPSGSVFVDVYPNREGAVFARGRLDAIEFLERAVDDPNQDIDSTLELLVQDSDGEIQSSDCTWMNLYTSFLEFEEDVFEEEPAIDAGPETDPVFIAVEGRNTAVSWERVTTQGYSQTEITIRFQKSPGPSHTETLSHYLDWTIPPRGDREEFWTGVTEILKWSGPPFSHTSAEEAEQGFFRDVQITRTLPNRLQEHLLEVVNRVNDGAGNVNVGPGEAGESVSNEDVDLLILAEDTIEGEVLREAIRLAQRTDTLWVKIDSGEALGQAVGMGDPVGIVSIVDPGPVKAELLSLIKSIRDATEDRSPSPLVENQ